MTRIKILSENQSYTFQSYFEMPYQADEILAELGYSLIRRHIDLPKSNHPLERLAELKQRIEESLTLVSLSSETARRETLVAPTLLEVARYCQCQIRIEYPLSVNNWLKGNLVEGATKELKRLLDKDHSPHTLLIKWHLIAN